jgi:hypothetical protein
MRRWNSKTQRRIERAAYNAGLQAFNDGRGKEANPYPAGCKEWADWRNGYNDGPMWAELEAKKRQEAAT